MIDYYQNWFSKTRLKGWLQSKCT